MADDAPKHPGSRSPSTGPSDVTDCTQDNSTQPEEDKTGDTALEDPGAPESLGQILDEEFNKPEWQDKLNKEADKELAKQEWKDFIEFVVRKTDSEPNRQEFKAMLMGVAEDQSRKLASKFTKDDMAKLIEDMEERVPKASVKDMLQVGLKELLRAGMEEAYRSLVRARIVRTVKSDFDAMTQALKELSTLQLLESSSDSEGTDAQSRAVVEDGSAKPWEEIKQRLEEWDCQLEEFRNAVTRTAREEAARALAALSESPTSATDIAEN